MNQDYSIYKSRREVLRATLREQGHKDGVVVLFADTEGERHAFRQESSFFYLTGISEPGAVLLSYLDGTDVLYVPTFKTPRGQWLTSALCVDNESALLTGMNQVKALGQPSKGYSLSPFFRPETYEGVAKDLEAVAQKKHAVFMLQQQNATYMAQLARAMQLASVVPGLAPCVQDVAGVLHDMRRTKDDHELEQLQNAIDITIEGQGAASMVIKPGASEREVQATIEYAFTGFGGGIAFPSIVAAGQNTCVLHYTDRNQDIKDGDLVVVDIGAEWGGYAADITRTYPANGTFTPRQREIYELVLACQAHVATQAKPGMYLRKEDEPEKSLHHIAVKFFQEAGYAQYFVHGIGHYLGLEVHDVGDVKKPLREGDVFTIEPGLYLNDEGIGVRIEDDYVIVDNGCSCLSEVLPKEADDIEAMLQGEFNE